LIPRRRKLKPVIQLLTRETWNTRGAT